MYGNNFFYGIHLEKHVLRSGLSSMVVSKFKTRFIVLAAMALTVTCKLNA